MFYVRQKTENLLVLGAPRIQELAGLFLLGAGVPLEVQSSRQDLFPY